MNKNKEYCVYKHTAPNGKVYIGQTCKIPSSRWSNGNGYKGNPYFWNAIQKYGWDSFKHEILYDGLTKEEADFKEIEMIAYYDSTNREYGYNISIGGSSGTSGFKFSDESRKKMSDSHKGIGRSKDCIENWRKTHEWYTHSEETRQKISDALKGRTVPLELRPNMKQVICIETGIIYISIAEASRQTGIDASSIALVCEHVKNRPTAGGCHWCFLDEYDEDTYVLKIPKTKHIPEGVVCLETKKIYDSIASTKYDSFVPRYVSECCRGLRKIYKGFHWQFYDDYLKEKLGDNYGKSD